MDSDVAVATAENLSKNYNAHIYDGTNVCHSNPCGPYDQHGFAVGKCTGSATVYICECREGYMIHQGYGYQTCIPDPSMDSIDLDEVVKKYGQAIIAVVILIVVIYFGNERSSRIVYVYDEETGQMCQRTETWLSGVGSSLSVAMSNTSFMGGRGASTANLNRPQSAQHRSMQSKQSLARGVGSRQSLQPGGTGGSKVSLASRGPGGIGAGGGGGGGLQSRAQSRQQLQRDQSRQKLAKALVELPKATGPPKPMGPPRGAPRQPRPRRENR